MILARARHAGPGVHRPGRRPAAGGLSASLSGRRQPAACPAASGWRRAVTVRPGRGPGTRDGHGGHTDGAGVATPSQARTQSRQVCGHFTGKSKQLQVESLS